MCRLSSTDYNTKQGKGVNEDGVHIVVTVRPLDCGGVRWIEASGLGQGRTRRQSDAGKNNSSDSDEMSKC